VIFCVKPDFYPRLSAFICGSVCIRITGTSKKIGAKLRGRSGAIEAEDILAEAIRRDAELESGAVEALSEQAFWDGWRRRNS